MGPDIHFHGDVHIHFGSDDGDSVIPVRLLHQIIEQNEGIMSNLDELLARVRSSNDLTDSLITLVQGLSADVRAHLNDPDQIAAILDEVDAQAAETAAAITANTVADPVDEPEADPGTDDTEAETPAPDTETPADVPGDEFPQGEGVAENEPTPGDGSTEIPVETDPATGTPLPPVDENGGEIEAPATDNGEGVEVPADGTTTETELPGGEPVGVPVEADTMSDTGQPLDGDTGESTV